MSFKAADNTPPKLDSVADPTLATKLFNESVPDIGTLGPVAKDATDPANGTLPSPFAPNYNDLEIVDKDKPKTPGAQFETNPDVLTDPFNPTFNVPGKAGDKAVKPDVLVNPFDPSFIELPKGGKDVPAPATAGPDSKLPPQLDVDQYDPFKDWNSVPGLTPIEPKPATPKDTTIVPGAELPKPVDPVVKPVEPVSPGGEVPKPTDKVVPPQPTDKVVPNPVFNEMNVGEAVKLAAAKNQPIIVISTPDGKIDATAEAAMKASASDAVFVNVNFSHADQIMRQGLETTHYWQLANLCGANGDVNNLYQKPGFIGRFNASDFKPEDPKGSLKAVVANDAEKVFAGTIKPPAPAAVEPGPVKPDGKIEPPVVPQPDGKIQPTDTKIEPTKEVPATPDKGPVKLDKADFTTEDADKAVKYAKDNNLPLIVYRGSMSCGNCPTTRANMAVFGKEIQGKATTEAVVLRLDYDKLNQVQRTNPAAANTVRELVPPGTGFPNVAVFNPNNLKQPLADVYGSDMSGIRGLVKTGQDSIKATTPRDTKPVAPIPTPTDTPVIPVKPNPEAIKPPVNPGKDAPVAPVKDAPAEPEKKGPVKLDKADFTSAEADKAIQYAKDNNLPLVVYRGAASCPHCPTTRGNMESFGKEIDGKPATDAVVLRLDWDQLGKIQRDNPAAAQAMRDVVPPGTSFPNVAVFNPNDLSRPLSSTYGSNINEIRALVKTGKDSVAGSDAVKTKRGTTTGAEAAPSAFNERNILSATKAANEKNIPLVSYVDTQADPKMASALKYLQDNGLASTVSISAPKAEQMLRTGLENKHYYALKNAMSSAQGTAGGAHLSSFAPANLKPGQQFAPQKSADAKASADQIVSFLKDSGVDLSKNNSEATVRALLDGAPIPSAPKAEAELPEAEKELPATPPEVKVPPVPESEKPVVPAVPAVKVPAVPEAEKPAVPPVTEVTTPEVPPAPQIVNPLALPEPSAVLDLPYLKPAVRSLPEVKDPLPSPPSLPEPESLPEELKKPETPAVPEVTIPPIPAVPAVPEPEKPAVPPVPELKKPATSPAEEVTVPPVPAVPEVKKPSKETALKEPTLPRFAPDLMPLDEIIPAKAEANVEVKNEFKAKDADEALKIIADAKAKNLPLVVHAMTVICTDQSCTPTYLPKGLPSQFGNEALFLELPRSGVKIPDGAQYDELRAINGLYKTTLEDHKTQLDLHVFNLNSKTSKYELNDGDGGAKHATGAFIRARLEAAAKDKKKP